RGVTPLMSLCDGAAFIDSQVVGYHQYQERLRERVKEQPERAEEILNSSVAKMPCPPSAAEVVRVLLDLGADATLKDNEGNVEIVNVLLKVGADPNKPANLNRPLLAACQSGHLPVVQRLIEGGADVALRHTRPLGEDCPAMNAYETAQWATKKEVMKFLKSIG